MKSNENYFAQLFYSGQYAAVISAWQESPNLVESHFVPIIGALAFSGRVLDATAIFKKTKPSTRETVECQFYLAVGLARLSKYAEARELLALNLRHIHKTTDPIERFFTYQGLAFYRFINGRFLKAHKFAELAAQASSEVHFVFGKVLSHDLLGHCQIRIGQISLGLKTLNIALNLVKKIGDGGIQSALTIGLSSYQARYQCNAKQAIKLLLKALKETKAEDNYSRASLLIELADTYINSGRCDLAKLNLEQAAKTAFESQNYRQEVMINLRFARLDFLAGANSQAQVSLNLCRRICNPRVDKPLLIEIMTLEAELYQKNNQAEKLTGLHKNLSQLLRLTGDYKGLRAAQKYFCLTETEFRKGEDLIGDIQDEQDSQKAVDEILKSGFLGLLYTRLGISTGGTHLYLNLIPGSITVFSNGQVHHIDQGLSPTLLKLILAIKNEGVADKEKLIRYVWGYEYNPLTHDSLVFTALARLRSLLGDFKDLILLTEKGYTFAATVEVINPNSSQTTSVENLSPETKAETSIENSVASNTMLTLLKNKNIEEYNFRQLQIIKYLQTHECLDIQIVQKLFKVSPNTASRDLSDLYKRGVAARVGRGRATKYLLANPKLLKIS